jgi:hypothetical protein
MRLKSNYHYNYFLACCGENRIEMKKINETILNYTRELYTTKLTNHQLLRKVEQN